MRARYSPIIDNIINNRPLKSDNKHTTDVQPGTGIPTMSFFKIKYKPIQNDPADTNIPINVISLSGKDE